MKKMSTLKTEKIGDKNKDMEHYKNYHQLNTVREDNKIMLTYNGKQNWTLKRDRDKIEIWTM